MSLDIDGAHISGRLGLRRIPNFKDLDSITMESSSNSSFDSVNQEVAFENNLYEPHQLYSELAGNPGILDSNGHDIREGYPSITTVSSESSWYGAVFLVANAALGAGLLNFPSAFGKSGGIAVATSLQLVLMLFIIGALVILAYCSDLNQSNSYQDVISVMCGPKAQLICSISIIIYTFGTCVTFFVIIADQWDKFLWYVVKLDACYHWYYSRNFILVSTSLILVLPICYPSKIDFLKIPSAIGVVGVLYCIFLVSINYFLLDHSEVSVKTSPDSWTSVFLIIPVICFGYQCHVSVIPIYSCMKRRRLTEFCKTIAVALLLCMFSYSVTATLGYLTFGDDVNEDILLSYKPTPAVLIAVILIAIKMYTTYPILLFVGRTAVENLWTKYFSLTSDQILTGERTRRIALTSVWFVTSLGLAVIVPNIGDMISVLGGLASTFIFLFPGLCLLQIVLQGFISKNESPMKFYSLLAVALFYIIFGAFLFGLVTTQAIWDNIYQLQKPSSGKCTAV